jgi:hypothetical protein
VLRAGLRAGRLCDGGAARRHPGHSHRPDRGRKAPMACRPGSCFRRITLPAMLPFAIPGMANLWLIVTKDTALIAVVGYTELALATRQAAGNTKMYLTFFLIGRPDLSHDHADFAERLHAAGAARAARPEETRMRHGAMNTGLIKLVVKSLVVYGAASACCRARLLAVLRLALGLARRKYYPLLFKGCGSRSCLLGALLHLRHVSWPFPSASFRSRAHALACGNRARLLHGHSRHAAAACSCG